jgi:hypothetical protein
VGLEAPSVPKHLFGILEEIGSYFYNTLILKGESYFVRTEQVMYNYFTFTGEMSRNKMQCISPLKTKISLNYSARFNPYRAVNTHRLGYKTSQLMLYREIIAVCSKIHKKHINTLCGQNVELYLKIKSVPRSKHTPSRL